MLAVFNGGARMIILTAIVIGIWLLCAFGFFFFIVWLAVRGFGHLSNGRTVAAGICLLGILACPAYSYYDWHDGETRGAPWTELKVARKPDGYDPVVLVMRDARFCGRICREVLARNFVERITLVAEKPPGSGKAQTIFTHHVIRDHRCKAGSQSGQPIQRLDDRNNETCIIGFQSSLPSQYTRIIYGETPFPRVRQAGFPVLSSNQLQGTYYMIVERVSGTRVDPIAQSFRHVRQPVPVIYGLQYIAPESPRFRQRVGARLDQYEALNQIMGWSMKGRLPQHDPKPVTPAFAPGTPTVLVCDEKKIPVNCELRPAPKT